MSSEAVTGVVGIASAAVAALGLLLTWYRHDTTSASRRRTGRGPPPRRILTRARVAGLCTGVIVVAAALGISLVLRASPAPRAGEADRLSEVQYTSQLSQMCLQSNEEAGRIEETNPTGPLEYAALDVEMRLLEHIEQLAPPRSYQHAHEALVATWQQRIALLQDAYPRLDHADETVQDEVRRAEELSAKVTEISTSLGAPECGFG